MPQTQFIQKIPPKNERSFLVIDFLKYILGKRPSKASQNVLSFIKFLQS